MGYEKFTEKDPLTDLHYIRSFMLAAGEFLRDAQPGAYGMVAVDMEPEGQWRRGRVLRRG